MTNLTITATDVRPIEIVEQMTIPAGETITAGQVCIPDATTAKAMKTNASEAVARPGVALTSATANFPTTLLLRGLLYLGAALAGMAYHAKVWISGTDGAMSDADPSKNEVQTLTFGGTPTGGTFTLTFGGQTTGAIAYNATSATVQTAMEALSTIGLGNILVTGTTLPDQVLTATFVNDLGKQPVGAITATLPSLTGGAPTCVIAESVAGVYGYVLGEVEPVPAETTPLKALRIGA